MGKNSSFFVPCLLLSNFVSLSYKHTVMLLGHWEPRLSLCWTIGPICCDNLFFLVLSVTLSPFLSRYHFCVSPRVSSVSLTLSLSLAVSLSLSLSFCLSLSLSLSFCLSFTFCLSLSFLYTYSHAHTALVLYNWNKDNEGINWNWYLIFFMYI